MDQERVTVKDASLLLGISEGAVRKRMARGSLSHERDEEGNVWVLLDAGTRNRTRAGDVQGAGIPGGQDADQAGQDAGESGQAADETRNELVEELRDRIAYLERQVEEEREARRRADTLMARLMDRVPELEAPRDTRDREDVGQDAGQPVGETQDTRGQDAGQDAANPPVRRSWWRRFFGFE